MARSTAPSQLGCAAALANLAIFRDERVLENLQPKIVRLSTLLESVRVLPHVTGIRQCGFIAGIDVVRDGAKVCLAARRHGLLTRPIRDTVVLMPPFCITDAQLAAAVAALVAAVHEVLA